MARRGTATGGATGPTTPAASRKGKRRGCLVRLAVAAALCTVAGVVAYHFTRGGPPGPGCTVQANGSALTLTTTQASNAATIAAVATARGLPERAMTIALATSLQESRLENIDHGDRDSLGLFQQRPSQGWGTAQQILDPVYASNAFFDSLVKIDGYTRLPLTVAAQRVQKSGFPQAYAKHEADATLLSGALSGRDAGALSCTTGKDSPDSAGGGPGDTAKVTARLTREFGPRLRPRADEAPGTVAVPSTPPGGSADADGGRRGWAIAQWAVAHAHDLRVEEVSYGGMHWQAAHSAKGWQHQKPQNATASGGSSAAASPGAAVRITVAP